MAPSLRRPKVLPVYFVIDFDKPFAQIGAWRKGVLEDFKNQVEGEKVGVYVSFPTKANEQRLMKVAISYVSTEQAALNLATELPHWDFDRVVEESHSEWDAWLGRIKVEGKMKPIKNGFIRTYFMPYRVVGSLVT